jgi:hypothetical protein
MIWSSRIVLLHDSNADLTLLVGSDRRQRVRALEHATDAPFHTFTKGMLRT